MERSDWRKTENDDDEPKTSGQSSRSAERQAPSVPLETPPRIEHRPVPAAPALEGVISWRQNEDLLRKTEKSETSKENGDDDDEEDEEQAKRQPAKAVGIASVPAANKIERTETDVFVYPEEASNLIAETTDSEPEEDADISDASARPRQTRASQPVMPVAGAALRVPPALAVQQAPRPAYQPSATEYRPVTPGLPEEAPAQQAHPAEAIDAPVYEPVPLPVQAAEAQPSPAQHYYETSDDYSVTAPLEATPEEPRSAAPLPPVGTGGYVPPERPQPFGYDPNMYPMPGGNEYPVQHASVTPGVERTPSLVGSHRHGEPLAAAVGIGLVAEHIGRKRADRKQQKQMDRMVEQGARRQEEAAVQHLRTQEQQRGFLTEQQRQTAELRSLRTDQERFATVPSASYNLEHPGASPQMQQRFEAAPQAPGQQPFPPIERPSHQQQPEHTPSGSVPDAEQQQGDQSQFENPALQPQQHFERSAWHNIVVDQHGHEVSGAMAYGQEFHRQREHEMLPDQVAAVPGNGSGASGGDAGAAHQPTGQPGYPSMYHQGQGVLPSGMTNPVLPPGHPTHVDPQHQLPATPRKQVTSNIANPWFWLMLLLIVAAFFTAALI